jgi:hypothetical protein
VSGEVAAFFAGSPLGLAVHERVLEVLAPFDDLEVRVTRSQVAFRRRRSFAFLWRPGMYLRAPEAEVVLSVALGRHDASPRWKQVVEPSPGQWMHHLEVGSVGELDDEVVAWLLEAAGRAG